MTGIIYVATNIETLQKYVGQTTQKLSARRCQHYNDGGGSKFHKALKKFQKSSFMWEIICECMIDELNIKEQYYINLYNTIENGYNSFISNVSRK